MTKARALADNLPEPTAGSDSLSVLNATSAALLKHKLDLNGTGGEIGSHDGDNVCQGFASDPYTGELYTIHSTNHPLDDTNVINKFDGNGAVVQTSTHHLDTPSTTLGKQQLAVSWDKNGQRWFWTGANARVSNQARYIRKFKITDGSGTDLNIASEVQYQVFSSTEINGISTGSATTCVSLDSRYLITEYSGSNTNRIKVFPLQTIDNYQGSDLDVSDKAVYNWTFSLNTSQYPLQGMASDGNYIYIFTGNVDPSESSTASALRVFVYTLTGTLVKEYTDFDVGETEAQGDGAGTKYEFQGAGWTWQSGVPYLSVIIASGDQNYRQNRIWALGGKKGISAGDSKIKQVVHTKQTSGFTSTSNSYTDVISCNITPTASDSTILVQAFVPMHITRNGDQLYGDYLVVRSNTNTVLNDRHPSGGRGIHQRYLTSHNDQSRAGITGQNTWVGIDAPSSTSQLTYKIQSRDTNGGAQNSHMDIDGAYLILMEIGA